MFGRLVNRMKYSNLFILRLIYNLCFSIMFLTFGGAFCFLLISPMFFVAFLVKTQSVSEFVAVLFVMGLYVLMGCVVKTFIDK